MDVKETDPMERVDFMFNSNLAYNGSWDYEYGREFLGVNTHLWGK
jgi:hypothetical protein